MNSNIIKEFIEDVNIKPSKSKLVIKWLIRIAIFLISIAFVLGQIKIKSINKVNNFEKSLQENTKATVELKEEMKNGFDKVNKRIDKVYDDGYNAFNNYQQYNNKILGMILDYGKSDKEMLKRMLDVMTIEKSKEIQNQLERAKTEPKIDSLSIIVRPVDKNKK
jgi:hypothetical protein